MAAAPTGSLRRNVLHVPALLLIGYLFCINTMQAADPAPSPAPAAQPESAEKQEFVYHAYIAKPAEDVWKALTTPDIINKYYMVPVLKLELKTGGDITYGTGDNVAISGKIKELRTPDNPEGKAATLTHTFRFHGSKDPESEVAYYIRPYGPKMCRLTLTHTFPKKCQTLEDISNGWPVILSSLKTLLETGLAMPWPEN
ncbi:hypothetical protein DB346_21960 [Verrucomicrobia bacterium LW23]|nr:hypothetical protein DB346_21960 [Verrucomicrobia bacterium LW23]